MYNWMLVCYFDEVIALARHAGMRGAIHWVADELCSATNQELHEGCGLQPLFALRALEAQFKTAFLLPLFS